ncbi:MAG: fibrobacter succinogenes major paralogous domain-containing protein [Imperialibacter sp.]|uniref:fibrobacter succinogenes major paralogous domain-containing protein n=1 Tax=Imperialibacter sp. TaxID=2038411 RepID=UPI0032ED65EF
MVRRFLYIIILLSGYGLRAQTPEKFPYQMVVRDAGNNILSNANLGLRISIVQGNESGSITYTETHSTSTSKSGFVSVVIGSGATTDNLSDIDWSMGPFFVKAEIDPTGATSYSLTSINELQSVPFAFYAKTTETLVVSDGHLLVGNSSNQATSVVMTGDATITNTGSIVIGSDIVNSAQVIDNSLLADDLATGSVTSDEILDGTIRNEDLNKSAIPLSGFGDPTASMDFGNQQISNLREQVGDQEVATKAYVDALEEKLISLKLAQGYATKDVDGNVYSSVTIGTQTWFDRNLATTKYNDGTEITLVSENNAWQNLSSPGYSWYENDQASYANYGALYNWFAIDPSSNGNKNVCPTGWHVPSLSDWNTLISFLGGTEVERSNKLRQKGTNYWPAPNAGATDEFRFRGLPGGSRNSNGSFSGIGSSGNFSMSDDLGGFVKTMSLTSTGFSASASITKNYGNSVRCLKD